MELRMNIYKQWNILFVTKGEWFFTNGRVRVVKDELLGDFVSFNYNTVSTNIIRTL